MRIVFPPHHSNLEPADNPGDEPNSTNPLVFCAWLFLFCRPMFITFRKKYIQVAAVVGLLVVVLLSILLSASLHHLKLFNYMDSLSLSVWMSSGLSHLSLTDPESRFNKKVTELMTKKVKEDLEDRFWVADTSISVSQTQLQIPLYFRQPDSERPDVQPFDPRFTLAFYYNYIREKSSGTGKITGPFHWADWLDMLMLDPYLFNPTLQDQDCTTLDARPYEEANYKGREGHQFHGSRPIEQFCVNDKDLPLNYDDGNRMRLGFNIKGYFGRMEEHKVVISGRTFLYTMAPPPTAVVFLTNDGLYNMQPSHKGKLLHNGLVDSFLESNDQDTINTLKQYRRLRKEVAPFRDDVVNDYEVHLTHEDFVLQPILTIKQFEEQEKAGTELTTQQKSYLNLLRYSVAVEKSPPKYFHEASFFGTYIGEHYDWRFFGGAKLGSAEQIVTLHRMIRVWLSFCRKAGVTTWLAHGLLLLWYWNGIAFPWDNDVDVQMPVMDLQKLSLHYNQSLIVEDPEDGFSRFFLDCGTFITSRTHANGNNNIDARFIDVDSGLYVDITALAVSDDKNPDRYDYLLPENFNRAGHSNRDINNQLQVYNCRNHHFTSLGEILPLVRSYAEGEVAYIPRRYSDILTTEYKDRGMLQKYFRGRLFMPQLRLWVHQDDLRFFLRYRKEWLQYYLSTIDPDSKFVKPKIDGDLTSRELSTLLNFHESDLVELLHNEDILLDYIKSRDMTLVHENEIMRLLFGKSTSRIVMLAPDFAPLKYEPFLYHMRHDYSTFEKEVARYTALYQKYLDSKARYQEDSQQDDN